MDCKAERELESKNNKIVGIFTKRMLNLVKREQAFKTEQAFWTLNIEMASLATNIIGF